MTALQSRRVDQSSVKPASRILLWAVLSALVGVIGLAGVMSSTNTHSLAALQSHDGELETISERAERLQAFSRHIRKASLTAPAEIDLPFGGFVGAASTVQLGARLKLVQAGLPRHSLEVVSTQKLAPSIGLAKAASRQIVDVILVTGRVMSDGMAAGPLVRFLVAVSPEEQPRLTDHQSL